MTTADVAPEAGVVVHHGLTPNDASLIALYHRGGHLLPADGG